jgi:hypothetical protein
MKAFVGNRKKASAGFEQRDSAPLSLDDATRAFLNPVAARDFDEPRLCAPPGLGHPD